MGVACRQGTLTLEDTWFRSPFSGFLTCMLHLLRPNFPNLPCLYSTFYLEYPSVLSRFCLYIFGEGELMRAQCPKSHMFHIVNVFRFLNGVSNHKSLLAHLSQRLKWAIVIVRRPSVCKLYIFKFFSRTAWWSLMKLGRDEVLVVPCKCCCFRPDPPCGKKCCNFWFHSEVKFLTRFTSFWT